MVKHCKWYDKPCSRGCPDDECWMDPFAELKPRETPCESCGKNCDVHEDFCYGCHQYFCPECYGGDDHEHTKLSANH